MLTKLTRKLFILLMLCASLTAVSSASTPTTKKGYCFEMPMCYEGCCSGYWCCDNYGHCTCG